MSNEQLAGKSEIILSIPEYTGNKERLDKIVKASGESLKHFFEKGVYGDPAACNPDTLPTFWPHVRYLVADILRPTFNGGDSMFADIVWRDQFLNDLTDEAWEIRNLLPEDLSQEEWFLMTKISAYMLMEDPLFIEKGFISAKGRTALITQSLLASSTEIDMYEVYWTEWKKKYADGARDRIIQVHQ